MSTTTITCPSGLTGEIRGLRIQDGRWLTNKQLGKQNKLIDRILQECWVRTADAGIYKLSSKTNSVDWLDVLVGDRDYALIAIRHESWGPYETRLKCQDRDCGHKFLWEIDLAELCEKQCRPLSEEGKRHVVDKVPFNVTLDLDTKRKVEFKLATGRDSANAIKKREQQRRQRGREDDDDMNVLLDAVKVRLVSVEGIDAREIDDYIESLEMQKLRTFIDAFDGKDCGIDTAIEYECPNCGEAGVTDFPFDQSFFFPEKRRSLGKVSKASSTTGSTSTTSTPGSASSSTHSTEEAGTL